MSDFSSFDEAKRVIHQLMNRQSDSSGKIRLVKVKHPEEDLSLYCYMTADMAVKWADAGYDVATA